MVTVRYWHSEASILTIRDEMIVVGNLPEGFRPPDDACCMFGLENECLGQLAVGADGNVCLTHRYGEDRHTWASVMVSVSFAVA